MTMKKAKDILAIICLSLIALILVCVSLWWIRRPSDYQIYKAAIEIDFMGDGKLVSDGMKYNGEWMEWYIDMARGDKEVVKRAREL